MSEHSYRSEVEQRLRMLEPIEIERRIRRGELTAEAQDVALRVLQDLGVDTSTLPKEPPSSDDQTPRSQPGFITRCLTGEERLWKAYWLLGLLIGLVQAPVNVMLQNGSSSAPLWFVLVSVPTGLMWCLAVWRCAFKASHWGWSVVARGVAAITGVLFAIAALKSAQVLYWVLRPAGI